MPKNSPLPEADGSPAADAAEYPPLIRLTHPHGFVDDWGKNRTWSAGDVVGDPAEIKLLIDRKASHEALE